MLPFLLKFHPRRFSLISLFYFILLGSINFRSVSFIFSSQLLLPLQTPPQKLRIAKRSRKIIRKLRLRKNYFKTNRLLYTYRLKFSSFFFYIQKRRLKSVFQISPLLKNNKWVSSFFFLLYKKAFRRRWFFLTGLAVSPLSVILRDKKRWLRKNLRARIRRNYKYYRFYRINLFKAREHSWTLKGHSFKRLKKEHLKKIYYDNIFYFLRSRINFRRLKFFIKLIRFKFPVHTRRGIYFKSYLFLNNFETRFKKSRFPLKHVYKTYKLHKKFFKILKRRNRWTKKWVQIWFKSYSNIDTRSNKQLVGFTPKLNIKYQLRKFFRLKKFWPRRKRRRTSFLSSVSRKKRRRKTKRFIFSKWRKPFAVLLIRRLRRRFFNKKLKRFMKRSHYLFSKIFRKHHLFFLVRTRPLKKFHKYFRRRRYQKWFNWRAMRRFRKWYLWNFINKRRLSWKNLPKYRRYKLKFTFRIKLSPNSRKFSISNFSKAVWSRLIKSSKLRFFKYSSVKKPLLSRVRVKFLPVIRIKSSIYSLLKKPFLTPSHRSNFTTNASGFLLLTNTLFLNYSNKNRQRVYAIKKILYAFAYKSDMRKHLLKKYTKWRHSTVLSRFFKKRKTLRRKKFFNPTYKEMRLSVKQLEPNFNSAISNLRSLLSRRFSSPDPLIETRFFKRKKFAKKRRKLKIRQIKFRPGLVRRWRRARRALLESLNLKPRYQHNLTKFIINYKKIMNTRFLPVFEMRLFNVLTRSRLVLDQITARKFIEGKVLFINGLCCSNPYLQLFANDFIQLIVTIKYYIVFRWLLNNSIKMKKRIKHFSWKNSKKKRRVDKQWNRRLQKTVLPHKHLVLDVAKYLEVDFFTLSAFVLYSPFLWSDLDRYNVLNVRYGVLNLYNWKYIT